MSHFTVLVVLPKEGIEKYDGANEHTGKMSIEMLISPMVSPTVRRSYVALYDTR